MSREASNISFCSSRFNTTVVGESFINPCCFGEDVGLWLAGDLSVAGVTFSPAPIPEDWGWLLEFSRGSSCGFIAIGLEEGSDRWSLWIEASMPRPTGLFRSHRRVADPSLLQDVLFALEAFLRASPDARDVATQAG